jgi:arsenate reductase (glutaredoxin)
MVDCAAMSKATLYRKSTCTSCRDARAALREKSIDFEDVNYAKTGLDAPTVERLVATVGAVAPLVNVRHAIAKERGWAEAPPSPSVFAKAVAAEPNLIRRPIFVRGGKVLVGFDKSNHDSWAKLPTS